MLIPIVAVGLQHKITLFRRLHQFLRVCLIISFCYFQALVSGVALHTGLHYDNLKGDYSNFVNHTRFIHFLYGNIFSIKVYRLFAKFLPVYYLCCQRGTESSSLKLISYEENLLFDSLTDVHRGRLGADHSQRTRPARRRP